MPSNYDPSSPDLLQEFHFEELQQNTDDSSVDLDLGLSLPASETHRNPQKLSDGTRENDTLQDYKEYSLPCVRDNKERLSTARQEEDITLGQHDGQPNLPVAQGFARKSAKENRFPPLPELLIPEHHTRRAKSTLAAWKGRRKGSFQTKSRGPKSPRITTTNMQGSPQQQQAMQGHPASLVNQTQDQPQSPLFSHHWQPSDVQGTSKDKDKQGTQSNVSISEHLPHEGVSKPTPSAIGHGPSNLLGGTVANSNNRGSHGLVPPLPARMDMVAAHEAKTEESHALALELEKYPVSSKREAAALNDDIDMLAVKRPKVAPISHTTTTEPHPGVISKKGNRATQVRLRRLPVK